MKLTQKQLEQIVRIAHSTSETFKDHIDEIIELKEEIAELKGQGQGKPATILKFISGGKSRKKKEGDDD